MSSNMLSEEFVQDSSDNEDPKVTTSKKFNQSISVSKTKKTKANISKPRSPSESESEASESDRESDAQSDGSSSTSSYSEGHDNIQTPRSNGVEPPKKKIKTSRPYPTRIAPKKFLPPAGYSLVTEDSAGFNSQVGNLFADLNGKSVWHITAPSTVPLNLIESLNIQSALNGNSILEHNGIKYNMHGTHMENKAMLLSDGRKAEYSACPTMVSRSFSLREMTLSSKDPNSSEIRNIDDAAFFAKKVGIKRDARKQPSGLRMRYQPYGSLKGSEKLVPPTVGSESNDEEGNNSNPHEIDSHATATPNSKTKKSKNEKKSTGNETRIPSKSNNLAPQDSAAKGSPLRNAEKKKRKKHNREMVEMI